MLGKSGLVILTPYQLSGENLIRRKTITLLEFQNDVNFINQY
jgi:hypothetical protein